MPNTALLLIDIQNDYFPDGKWPLVGQENAAQNATRLLKHFRDNSLSVFHVRHVSGSTEAPFFAQGTLGSEIHASVQPLELEQVFIKSEINCFKGTDLLQALREQSVSNLVIVGSMSHMCIDAATRAAADYGFDCTVAKDACATLDLEFDGNITPAAQVQNAYMAGLAFAYAKVVTTDEALIRI